MSFFCGVRRIRPDATHHTGRSTMRRRGVELERREWPTKGDAQRVVYAVCTWCPTDRVNGCPARYLVQFGNVRREARDTGSIWETGDPYETWSWTVCVLPRGARRSVTWDDKARARFAAYVADYLPDYVARYGLSIDAATPSACVP